MKIVYDNVIFENNRSGAIIQCSIPLVSFCVCVAAEGYTLASSHGLIAAREYTRGTGKKQHPPRKRTISTFKKRTISAQVQKMRACLDGQKVIFWKATLFDWSR